MTTTYQQLREYIFTLDIIDTHEHVPPRESDRPIQNDVLAEYLAHYFSCDLVSAGLRPNELEIARDPAGPLADRWKLIEPYWQAARNTGYARSLDIVARDLYGFDRIDAETIAPLDEAFKKSRSEGNTYRKVLKEKSNIRVSVLDSANDLKCDREFFRPAFRLDNFVDPANRNDIDTLSALAGRGKIHTLDDLTDACEAVLDDALEGGAVCLKTGLAYRRSLTYSKATFAEAEAQFNSIFTDAHGSPLWDPAHDSQTDKLQDFMMHHVCRLADKRGLTMQAHTGLQEGNGNFIYNSDPTRLSNLFLDYPDIKFDIFHIGYPYQQSLSALAKNFRNVFIDFSWAQIISPTASINALVEYLDAVPANKIFGFGGDYVFVDGIYGHQYIARENVARALAFKVQQGDFDLDRAKQLAKMILHDNPAAVFNLD